MRNKNLTAPLFALAALSLIWGYNWVLMKDAVLYSGPFIFTANRSLGGGIALFAFMAATKRSMAPGSFWGVFLLGLGQTAGFLGLATWALVSGAAGKTAVLVYTMPLWVLLFAWPILHERLHGIQWLVVAMSLTGLACIIQPWNLHSGRISITLAVSAGIVWALASIWAKLLRKKYPIDLLALTAWQLILGSLPLFVVAFLFEHQSIHWSNSYLFDLAYNIVPVTIGWILWLYALHELPAGLASLGTLLTPVIGVFSSRIQLGEIPGPWDIAGMLLIFAGLALLSLNRQRTPPEMNALVP